MIPLLKTPMPHTSESSAIVFNNRFERSLWSKHTLAEVRNANAAERAREARKEAARVTIRELRAFSARAADRS